MAQQVDLVRALDVAVHAARSAGAVIRAAWEAADKGVQVKGSATDLVTGALRVHGCACILPRPTWCSTPAWRSAAWAVACA